MLKKYVLPLIATLGLYFGTVSASEQNPAFLTVTTPTIYTEIMTDVAEKHGLEQYFNHNTEDGEAVQIGIKYKDGYVLTINYLSEKDLEGYNRTTFMNNTISSSKVPKSISLKLSEEEGTTLLNDFYKKALNSGSIGDAYLILQLRLEALEDQLKKNNNEQTAFLVEELKNQVQTLYPIVVSLEESQNNSENRISSLEALLEQQRKIMNRLLEENNFLREEFSSLREYVEKLYSSLNGHISFSNERNKRLEGRVSTAEYNLRSLREELSNMREEFKGLKTDYANLKLESLQRKYFKDPSTNENSEKTNPLFSILVNSVYIGLFGLLLGAIIYDFKKKI